MRRAGFGLCGTPDTLIEALAKRKDVEKITAVSNNVGSGELGLGTQPSRVFGGVHLSGISDRQAIAYGPYRQDDVFVHRRVSTA